MIEGALPFIFLPIWWFCIRDHPREAKWISAEEKITSKRHCRRNRRSRNRRKKFLALCAWRIRSVFVMIAFYFLHNCAAYGCDDVFHE